ncbi:MAG TPA: cytochrome c1 [Gammaproteobacteria bacterium]|nr:cytochrome c1 [Gammaproteobacteria bacterium]
MRLRAVACVLCLAWGAAAFAAETVELEPANNNLGNTASLQRGAKYFVNYCLGCHSAKYVRYNRLAQGLQLSDKQLIDNLMFTGEQPFDTMSNAMRPEDAERWFGKAPPDLSLIARSRGPDYIYNYLRGFYEDDKRPTGANNIVLQNTAMPDVLWELQGIRRPVHGKSESGAGGDDAAAGGDAAGGGAAENEGAITGFEVVRPGLLTEPQFDQVARDIVNFLDYIGEPMRQERERLGLRVIGFLLVFLLVAFMLKKEIWKDVH